MRPRSRRNLFPLHGLPLCQLAVVVVLWSIPVFASTTDKLLVRDNVSKQHREELLQRLRTITGWTDLAFNKNGGLQTNKTVTRGSESARELMKRALSSNRRILFEDASSRKDVVFCRVILGKVDPQFPDGELIDVIQIDFADFRQVTGDKEARAAFDVGWAVLHELDHAVEDSRDPEQEDIAGDCEDHINRMRRELGLPVRGSYFYTLLPIRNDSNLISRFVRLGFDLDDGPASKRRRYWLIWDAAVVGGLG